MNSDQDRQRAENAFKKNEEGLGARTALTEYEVRALAIREKIKRLKALRLEKEAQAQVSNRDK